MTGAGDEASPSPGPVGEPASDVVRALQARGRFGVRLGLARTRALLAAVGSPERQVPGVLIGVSTAARTAEVACGIVVAGAAPGATPEARWEWTGAEGPGWYCYASAFGGREVQLRFLGFIPEVRYRGDPPGVGV